MRKLCVDLACGGVFAEVAFVFCPQLVDFVVDSFICVSRFS